MENDAVTLTVAGAPVRAHRGGSGPRLVLLHGGGLDSACLTWAPTWSMLVRDAQVLAPDLPGYGGTPLGVTRPTLAGYRDWLLALLDVVGWDRVAIAGLSLGAGVALRTALDEPGRVEGLALLAPYGISRRVPGGHAGYLAVHLPGLAACHTGEERLRRARRRSGVVCISARRGSLARARDGPAR
jgi:pimeloyl-ACP methyl ester carboxylesterase